MNRIKGWARFFENNLKVDDLGTRKRGDVLVAKLRANDDIELNNGRKVDIEKMKDPDVDGDWTDVDTAIGNITDDEGRFDVEKASDYLRKNSRATKVFKDEDDGSVYKLTDFKKTTDFGSSGSGRRIREHESIQALFLAKRIADGVDIPNDPALIRKVMQDISKEMDPSKRFVATGVETCEVNVSPSFVMDDEIIDYYVSDPAWVATFAKVPNLLAKFSVRLKDQSIPLIAPGRSYVIYHISSKGADSIPAKVISKYNQINREAGFSVEMSKFNPADVYMVERERIADVVASIDSCGDILEFNTALNSMFDERVLIPISLKRSGPADEDTFIVVNAVEDMELPEFEVRKLRVSGELGRGIGTKIVTMSTWLHDGETIETPRNLSIDSPNTNQNVNVDGEIDGKWARQGKISLAWMKRFIEESPLYGKVRDYVEDEPINTHAELGMLDEEDLEELLATLNADVKSMERDMTVEVIPDTRGRSTEGESRKRKLISKVQSMQVIRALAVIDSHDSGKDRAIDDIVSNMLLYALSIKNPNFTSPRYVRVVER